MAQQVFDTPLNSRSISGYTAAMLAPLPTRLALIAVLVFAQALYAGHSVVHDSGGSSDCQICLQTSVGGAALPTSGFANDIPVYVPIRPECYTAPVAPAFLTFSHQSRAPPLLPV